MPKNTELRLIELILSDLIKFYNYLFLVHYLLTIFLKVLILYCMYYLIEIFFLILVVYFLVHIPTLND